MFIVIWVSSGYTWQPHTKLSSAVYRLKMVGWPGLLWNLSLLLSTCSCRPVSGLSTVMAPWLQEARLGQVGRVRSAELSTLTLSPSHSVRPCTVILQTWLQLIRMITVQCPHLTLYLQSGSSSRGDTKSGSVCSSWG